MLLPSQGGLLHGIGIGKIKLPMCTINHYTMQVYGREGMVPHITELGITWKEW